MTQLLINLEGARGAKHRGTFLSIVSEWKECLLTKRSFWTTGQTLTIRQDSSDRSSFMPGVLMAIKGVLTSLVSISASKL